MPELEKVFAAHRNNPRFAMLGVSLDESAEAARAFAEKQKLPWATGWLDVAGRVRLLDSYGVRGTPTVFLLDPEGKAIARDIKPASLAATVEKVLATK